MEFFSTGAEGYLEKTLLYHPVAPHTLSNQKHRTFPGMPVNWGWLCVGAVSFQTEEIKQFSESFKYTKVACFRFSSLFFYSFIPVISKLWDHPLRYVYPGPICWVLPSRALLAFESPGGAAPQREQASNIPSLPPLSLYGLEIGSCAASWWLVWGQKTVTSTATVWTTWNNLDESFPQTGPHLQVQIAKSFIFDESGRASISIFNFSPNWFKLSSPRLRGICSLPSKFSLQG